MARLGYDMQLKELKNQMMLLGSMVEEVIRDTISALVKQDTEKAREIVSGDEKINEQVRNVEQQCYTILLRQQPIARDLRAVSAALKMLTDMERIGDHAADVADLVLNVPDCKYGKMNEITEMSSEIIKMLHDAVQSYIDKDFNKAKNVIAHDDVIDDLYHVIKKDLVEKIRETTEGETILDYLLIAKYIERIGDHATNIAEWVIFALTGERG